MRHFVSQPGKRKNMPGIAKSTQSRRTFCGSVAHFTSALAFLPLADLFASCDTPPKKQILRPSVQINTTSVITNTRYIGDAFVFPEQMVFASLVPKLNRIPAYAPGISFLGIIAQDTSSFGYSSLNPRDVALAGLFKQNNGTFRYGYEINGGRHFARGHVQGLDYLYNINFRLNGKGVVADPDYPHQRRFGYFFQVSSRLDASTRIQALQSSPIYADQLFVGVMDESNNVRLPDNKQLQLYVGVSGNEQAPDVLYKNDDDTNQVSSQFSSTENRIILTLTGSS